MSIRSFFGHVGHDIKVAVVGVGHEFKVVFVGLFGQQALTQLETTAETMFKSDFGEAIMADAIQLVADFEAGRITPCNAVANFAHDIVTLGEKAGKSIGTTLATVVASMAIAKAQGVLTVPAPAPGPVAAQTAAPPATEPIATAPVMPPVASTVKTSPAVIPTQPATAPLDISAGNASASTTTTTGT